MHRHSFHTASVGFALLSVLLLGCQKDMTPTRTSPDAIDAYLEENPDEAYSSDGLVEEMTEDEDDGEGGAE